MSDYSGIFLTHTLRATIEWLGESPSIDPCHPGIVEFRRVLEQTVAHRLRGNDLTAVVGEAPSFETGITASELVHAT